MFGTELKDGRNYYYVIWVVLLGAVWLTQNLLDSREGRAIRALKGGVVMAESMGVDTARSKVVIFLVAALFASISGWLYAHLQRFVNPTPFGLHIGIEYLFMAVVGGAAHVWGALIGAGVITVLKQWLQDWLPRLLGASGNFEMIVFGVHDDCRLAACARWSLADSDALRAAARGEARGAARGQFCRRGR